jgi:hypothetical protein
LVYIFPIRKFGPRKNLATLQTAEKKLALVRTLTSKQLLSQKISPSNFFSGEIKKEK